MAIDVQTEVFEGPFDLLLHLILRDQVELYDVSLSKIVDAYLEYLTTMSNLDLDVATEFLLIAATLVDLKARRLLPGLDDGELDDELGIWEERDLLLARLLECKTFKDAAIVLADLHATAGQCFARSVGPDERYIDLTPDSLVGVTPLQLRAAFMKATAPKPEPRIDLFHVAPIRASVVEAVAELIDELPRVGRISFRDLTAAFVEKLEIVVRFLAILELFKQGYVDLDQPANFGDIQIRWTGGEAGDVADLELVDMYEG
ncbi:MAG: segregation/condensation protein A [Microthrixaceae bacterium]|nr:segregation/condensation protein A [Microthrixaceae bacterium]